jgi:hypothetical protein
LLGIVATECGDGRHGLTLSATFTYN